MTRAALAALALSLALAPPAAAQASLRGPTAVDSLAKVRVTQDFLKPRTLVGLL